MTDAIAYLSGEFVALDEAKVPVLDRGFIFGDGVYEVIPVYEGETLRLREHLERFERSLQAVQISPPLSVDEGVRLCNELVQRNGGGNLALYLQITRGYSPTRDHGFPEDAQPTVFAMATPVARDGQLPNSVSAVTSEDIRWTRCDIKATCLLPNVLLKQGAVQRGVSEVILIRDGELTEAAAANVFIVKDGCVITPPKSTHILGGITRELVIELAQELGLKVKEEAVPEAALEAADEIWISSSVREVLPVVQLNGHGVGAGAVGPVWRQIYDAYQRYKSALK